MHVWNMLKTDADFKAEGRCLKGACMGACSFLALSTVDALLLGGVCLNVLLPNRFNGVAHPLCRRCCCCCCCCCCCGGGGGGGDRLANSEAVEVWGSFKNLITDNCRSLKGKKHAFFFEP